ncbi:MAG: phosphotransferase [Candidatus Dojkabacteria bacterium]|jgi:Ser/Thr protein kinase RdoA (MazF antagonist)|nr:phosphotransferase [Candidatus Dojkabacteria bacterium]
MNPNLQSKISNLYPITKDIRLVESVKEGYLSQNYILYTSKQKFFLKQYSPKHTLDALKDVHKVKFFFNNGGIPVILPYSNINGETITEENGQYYTIFPFVEGKILTREDISKGVVGSYGNLLAKVHTLSSKGIPFEIESTKGIWNSEKFLSNSMTILKIIEDIKTKNEFDYLAIRVLNKKIDIVKSNRLLPEELELKNDHLLHGDFHEKNVFLNIDGSVKYLFDWEKTCIGPRVFELVRAIDFICLDGEYEEENIECARSFLRAYNDVYPVQKEDFYKGVTSYYIKKAHSLWIETDHYINNSQRVDIFLEREYLMLDYYKENYGALVDKVYQRIS